MSHHTPQLEGTMKKVMQGKRVRYVVICPVCGQDVFKSDFEQHKEHCRAVVDLTQSVKALEAVMEWEDMTMPPELANQCRKAIDAGKGKHWGLPAEVGPRGTWEPTR